MTAPTPHDIQSAVTAALTQPNGVLVRQKLLLPITTPCRGRTDLAKVALTQIASMLNEGAGHTPYHTAMNAQLVAGELTRGLNPSTRTALKQPTQAVVDALTAWVNRHGYHRDFRKALLAMRRDFDLPLVDVAPVTVGPESPRLYEDERVGPGWRFDGFGPRRTG